VSKPNHAYIFIVASLNPSLSDFDSINQRILDGLRQGEVSVPNQVLEIHECTKIFFPLQCFLQHPLWK
jgi:hypothetical protein